MAKRSLDEILGEQPRQNTSISGQRRSLEDILGNDRQRISADSAKDSLNKKELYSKRFIPQFTKSLYEGVPFGKRVISMMPNAEQIKKNIEGTPKPENLRANIGKFTGEIASTAPAISTFSGLGMAPVAAGALGIGTQTTGQRLSEGRGAGEALAEGVVTGGISYGVGKAAEPIARGVIKFGNDLINTPKDQLIRNAWKSLNRTGKNIIKSTDDKIFNLYNYSIGGKVKNVKDVTKIKPLRVKAVRAISENVDNIKFENPDTGVLEARIPKNRLELLEAHRQTKKLVWDKVTQLSEGATEKNATIDIASLADDALNETRKQIGKIALRQNKNLDKALEETANRIKAVKTASPTQSEEYMKYLNNEIQRLRNSGKAVDYSVKDLYSNLIIKLGDKTDDVIEQTLSKSGYKEQRLVYSALKSAEKEMIGAANNFLRTGQGGKGLVHPIVNLWTLKDILQGIATGKQAEIGHGILIKTSSKILDYFTNPDRRIPQMFQLLKK